ncbi:MAG: carboxymuconolactone decarboxylase family protein [Pseudomonadota bacterium]
MNENKSNSPELDEFIQFRERRKKGNEVVLDTDNKVIKRFFNLDTQCYKEGALDKSTKELLGLVASLVLRCNDCIDYHVEETVKSGLTNEQIEEAMSVALVVGGSIVIPHLRHAKQSLLALREELTP